MSIFRQSLSKFICRLALVTAMFTLTAVTDVHAADVVAEKPPTPAVILERDFYNSTYRAHALLERYVPPGAMLFFGDSHIQQLRLDSLHRAPANFGIPGDTTVGIWHRLKKYTSLKTASAVLLEGGLNDLGFGRQFDNGIVKNYARMLKHLPKPLDIYILGIFPVNESIEPTFANYNDRIKKINRQLASLCSRTPDCTFISVNAKLMGKNGQAAPQYLRPKDGAHLNKAGQRLVLNEIRNKLKSYNAPVQEGFAQDQVAAPATPTLTE